MFNNAKSSLTHLPYSAPFFILKKLLHKINNKA